MLTHRGVIEGFYGAPWSHAERLRMLSFIGGLGMNLYVYAPKDDPFHRARWREPYPADVAQLLGELAAAAAASGVEFVYALHPGLDLDPASDADHAALGRKTRELHALGVRRFALLFDDIPLDDPAALGRAHGETCARYEAEVLAALGIGDTLLMVPTDYAGSGRTPYRDGLAATLPATTGVFWTGDDIVVGEVTAAQARGAQAAFGGRPLLLWDNFPVNDFDRSRAFLGPLLGRDPELDDLLAGIVANPMVEYEPSRFALHTVAEWARDPRRYDAGAAAERALQAVAGPDAELLRPLLAATSSWPPSAPQYPALAAAVESGEGLERLLDGLDGLAALEPRTRLREALLPWAQAAPLTTAVIRAARNGEDAAAAWEVARRSPHGVARDVARAAAERAVGHALPDRVRPEGDPAAQASIGD
jgi:hypothetical protein